MNFDEYTQFVDKIENPDEITLTDEMRQHLMDACLNDATKVIRYLEEEKRKNRAYNTILMIFAGISAICAILATFPNIIPFINACLSTLFR